MKKAAAWIMVIVLILGCLSAYAAWDGELTEVRCDEWHFSVRIPAGMSAAAYDWEDPEYEKTTGGGLAVSVPGQDELPKLWILRRDHAFNNPVNYITEFCWQYYNDQDAYFDDTGYGLYEYGGITLLGAGCRFLGDADETLFEEYRFIPYRDDRGTEFVLRYNAENEEAAYALLDTVIRNYAPDGEPETAEAKVLPIREEPDLQNGTFRVSFEDVDKISSDGYCTAVLYTTDYYRAEDVRGMKPGDTVRINDRTCTVTEIDDPEEAYEPDILLKETAVEQSFWGMSFIPAESGERYLLYIMDDWYSVSMIGDVRVDAALPVRCYNVSDGEDEPVLADANVFANDSGILRLTKLTPYNTYCELKDGQLIRILFEDYPVGPVDPFVPVTRE